MDQRLIRERDALRRFVGDLEYYFARWGGVSEDVKQWLRQRINTLNTEAEGGLEPVTPVTLHDAVEDIFANDPVDYLATSKRQLVDDICQAVRGVLGAAIVSGQDMPPEVAAQLGPQA